MKNKNILLYHYTNIKISGTLTPRYFGENSYTSGDLRTSSVKRLFFYTEPKPEYLLAGSRFLYTCRIDEKKIYNLIEDKKQYLKNQNPNADTFNFTLLLNKIKKNYSGVKYNLGTYNVIILFKAVKPFKCEAQS